jgi:hypothetical protein
MDNFRDKPNNRAVNRKKTASSEHRPIMAIDIRNLHNRLLITSPTFSHPTVPHSQQHTAAAAAIASVTTSRTGCKAPTHNLSITAKRKKKQMYLLKKGIFNGFITELFTATFLQNIVVEGSQQLST